MPQVSGPSPALVLAETTASIQRGAEVGSVLEFKVCLSEEAHILALLFSLVEPKVRGFVSERALEQDSQVERIYQ